MTGAGYALLALAALAAFAGLVLPLLGRLLRRQMLVRAGMAALYAVLGFAVAAMLLLLAAFLARDFGNLYVYEHSSRALSGIYTVSALWAGNPGSLLLWLLLMALFAVLAVRGGAKRDPGSASYLMAVLSFISLFFSLLLLFGPRCNPFAANPASPVPADGLGLNPMLRNPGMIIHPVALYLGYVAMAVPFGLVVAGLVSGSKVSTWVVAVRRWALVGWLFLTIGNVVGAWWAYVTLGWGGYWAWDPVENASLIPWLTATALLHSAIVVHRRQRQQIWMVSLAALTFLLTIFGTFLTRTGVAASVHAFTEPRLIAWFAIFMVLMFLLPVGLLVKRYVALRSGGEPSALFSDESNLLYTVILLSVVTFFILWGVVYPPIAQSITGREFVFGTGFFDSVTAPLGLVLLLLIAVCALSTSFRGSRRRLLYGGLGVAATGLVVLVVPLSTGVRRGYPILAFAFCAAAIVATALMFLRGWRNKRRYGALIVHLGLLILIVGLAGSWAFKQSVEGQVALGESLTLGKYQVSYQDLQAQAENNTDRSVTRATLALSIGGDSEGQLAPSLEYYPASDQTWTRVARRTSAAGDVYVSLLSVDANSKTADFRLEYHPLIIWLWIGGGIMSLGALFALWSLRRRRPAAAAGAALGGSPRASGG